MKNWIIPANMKFYNVIGAYTAFDEVDWRLTSTPEVGDIVYIYLSRPYQCVKFKTRVVANNIPYSDSIKDEEFYTDKDSAAPNGKLYTRLAIEETYPDDAITRVFLKEHGVKGNIQCARRLPDECVKAINEIDD